MKIPPCLPLVYYTKILTEAEVFRRDEKKLTPSDVQPKSLAARLISPYGVHMIQDVYEVRIGKYKMAV